MKVVFLMLLLASIIVLIVIVEGCSGSSKNDDPLLAGRKNFQVTTEGKQTDLFVLRNNAGMNVAITNYGGRVVNLVVPDKNGKPINVVVGFDSLYGYKNSTEPYFGATIGRYGNRIAKGSFLLRQAQDDKPRQCHLSINNGPNTLHGGKNGFQFKVWDAEQLNDSTLELSYLSKDGEEGFPGNLKVKVIYSLTANKGLKCEYEATTDQPTVVNLTNHAFFNLNGEGSGTINNHILQINADQYTPVDSTLIPTGEIASVQNTPFDFRNPTMIGARVNENDTQLQYGKGYDHNFVLNGKGWKHAATAIGDKTGIVMDVFTEEPGLQFYSGNFMQSKNKMRKGKDDFRTAFCLETQHFPDSPNEPSFPSTVLKPGEVYHTVSEYVFSVK